MIARIDEFIFKIVEACLDWLNEWLSITQKQVLSALLVTYGTCWIIGATMEWSIFAGALISILPATDWFHRDRTNSQKIIIRVGLRPVRLFFLSSLVIAFIMLPYMHARGYPLWCIGGLACALFNYGECAFIDSERGGKRKLALAKLKELFGALEWIPAPEMGQ